MSDATRNFSATDLSSGAESGADSPESVGGALRKARETRGLSLPQASRDLCLKEDVLRALESRQYSVLPKVPYCFGFVRTYARYLNLEPEEMVRRFKGEIGDAPPPAKLLPPQPLRSSLIPGRAALTLSVLIASAVYGGWYFYMAAPDSIVVPATSADANDPMPPVMPIDAATAKKLNTETDAAHADDPAKSGATTSAVPGVPVKTTVVIKATATCWVYIHDLKGKAVFHKTMQKGEEFKIPDNKGELVLEIGNPAALQISVNGRILKAITGGPKVHKLNVADLSKLP